MSKSASGCCRSGIRGRRLRTAALGLVAAAGLTACGESESASAGGGDGDAVVTLTGAGATFPYPIYARWFSVYTRDNPVRVNYQSIGSGGGIRQAIEGTVDFGGTDAPLSEEDLEQIPGTLSLPTVLGAVSLTYNLPELTETLRLDGPTVARIYLGEIESWNDPRITELNPGIELPSRRILTSHRSDGSGTTYVFTDYLSKVSTAWEQRVGTGNAVRWPGGLGARGNEGVTGQVRQSPGAIGYVEQVYARQNQLPMARMMNAGGEFVQPSLEAITAAAAAARPDLGLDGDFRSSIVNADGEGAYPISAWTYILVQPHYAECRKARALADVLEWSLTEGTAHALELGYAPLPGTIRERALEALSKITCGPDEEPLGSR